MAKKQKGAGVDTGMGFFLSVSICFLLIALSTSVTLYVFYHKNPDVRIKIDKLILVLDRKTSINLQKIFNIGYSVQVQPKQDTLLVRNDHQLSTRPKPLVELSPLKKRVVRLPRRKKNSDPQKKIYHWEEDGVLHYSDSPPEDDELLLKSWDQIESKPNLYARNNSTIKRVNPLPVKNSFSEKSKTIPAKPVSYNEPKKKEFKNSFQKISNGRYQVNGYMVDISAHRTGDLIKIRGRISDGESCDNLRVYARFESRNGRAASAQFNVSNVGPGRSDTMRKDLRVGKGKSPSESYQVTNISVSCR